MSTVKHKPATPLPWGAQTKRGDFDRAKVTAQISVQKNSDVTAFLPRDDSDYIAHAANAYPKLVEALKTLHRVVYIYQDGKAGNLLDMPVFKDGETLLRELGEGS